MKESTKVFIGEFHNLEDQPLGRYYLHLGPNMGNGINLKPLSFQEDPPEMYWSNPYFELDPNAENSEDTLRKILDEISESFEVSTIEALQMIVNSGLEGIDINSEVTQKFSPEFALTHDLPFKNKERVKTILPKGKEELAGMIEVGDFFREQVIFEKTTQ